MLPSLFRWLAGFRFSPVIELRVLPVVGQVVSRGSLHSFSSHLGLSIRQLTRCQLISSEWARWKYNLFESDIGSNILSALLSCSWIRRESLGPAHLHGRALHKSMKEVGPWQRLLTTMIIFYYFFRERIKTEDRDPILYFYKYR